MGRARIFTNGPRKDYVIKPFNELADGASQIYAISQCMELAGVTEGRATGAASALKISLNGSRAGRQPASVNWYSGSDLRQMGIEPLALHDELGAWWSLGRWSRVRWSIPGSRPEA